MHPCLLSDKIVVLIGGAGLLGQSFARALIEYGATVILSDINLDKAIAVSKHVRAEIPNAKIITEEVDVTNKNSLVGLIERVSVHGRIDAVVNNAYPRNRHYGRKLADVTYDDFCENVNLHLGGYFLSTQQFSEYFIKQNYGHVINIASIYGVVAPRFDIYDKTEMTMPVEYAAIKSAIIHLNLYFMRYYKGSKLRFNVISPGGIINNQSPEFVTNYKRYAQAKGLMEPADIVGTLIYLISDLSLHVNGQNIIVDDGWSK